MWVIMVLSKSHETCIHVVSVFSSDLRYLTHDLLLSDFLQTYTLTTFDGGNFNAFVGPVILQNVVNGLMTVISRQLRILKHDTMVK